MHKLLLVTIEKNFTSVKNKLSKNEKRVQLIMGKMPNGASMNINLQ
jgi:hypothetical protein